jgi:hypothetical protein
MENFEIDEPTDMSMAFNLASQMSKILDGKAKKVKRDAMRALASLLGGQFVLDKDMEKKVATLVARSRPKSENSKDEKKGKGSDRSTEPQAAAEWKKSTEWTQYEEKRARLLGELKEFEKTDESEGAIAARNAYKAHLNTSKALKERLRA